jgi:NADH-quinone oxidoreductase subunit L
LDHLEIASTLQSDVLLVMLISTFMVAGGIALGWWLYGQKPVETAAQPDVLERLPLGVFAWLREKFYIDQLYEATVVRLTAKCALGCYWLDRIVFASLVQLVAYLVLGLSWLNRLVDEFIVNLGFDKGCNSLRFSARILSFWQNGQVQRYLRVLGLALAIFALIFIWGCE